MATGTAGGAGAGIDALDDAEPFIDGVCGFKDVVAGIVAVEVVVGINDGFKDAVTGTDGGIGAEEDV